MTHTRQMYIHKVFCHLYFVIISCDEESVVSNVDAITMDIIRINMQLPCNEKFAHSAEVDTNKDEVEKDLRGCKMV